MHGSTPDRFAKPRRLSQLRDVASDAPSDGDSIVWDASRGLFVPRSLASMPNPMTTSGDLIVGGSDGGPERLPIGGEGQVLSVASGSIVWADASGGGGGSGTVESVAVTAPAELTVAGSPVTTSGTIALTWVGQSANRVLASPDGASGTPSFRALVSADIPPLDASKIASGTIAGARLPAMGASGAGHQAGLVPDPGSVGGLARYLREDGTWAPAVSTATSCGARYFGGGAVTCPSTVPHVSTSWSMACWIRMADTTSSGRMAIWSRWISSGGGRELYILLSGRKPQIEIPYVATIGPGATAISDTLWHLLVLVRSGSAWYAYVDTAKSTLSASTAITPEAGGAASIGANIAGGDYLAATLCQVTFWSIALSDSDVATLATRVQPTTVQPASVSLYVPLTGLDYPEIDGSSTYQCAVTGATAPAVGPLTY